VREPADAVLAVLIQPVDDIVPPTVETGTPEIGGVVPGLADDPGTKLKKLACKIQDLTPMVFMQNSRPDPDGV